MSMHIDGKKVTAMYWGGRKIREAWYEGQRVFSGRPVEVMPAVSGTYDARNWLREKLYEYGEYDYRMVEEIPFEIDSSNATTMRYMFYDCSSLTTAPPMDTSNVTDASYMFYDCSSLTTVPPMDTSNVTDMRYMFQHCRALTTVPAMDTAQVTDASYMFYDCSSLTDGNVRLIGKKSTVVTTAMILNSGLTRLPFYDSSGQPI